MLAEKTPDRKITLWNRAKERRGRLRAKASPNPATVMEGTAMTKPRTGSRSRARGHSEVRCTEDQYGRRPVVEAEPQPPGITTNAIENGRKRPAASPNQS